MKSRASSVGWAPRFYPPRAASCQGAGPRNKKGGASCWLSSGNPGTMSRIGNKPVEIPAKVKVNIDGNGKVAVEGPKGKLDWTLPKGIKASVADNEVSL